MEEFKLNKHPSAACTVVKDGKELSLVSYRTTVAIAHWGEEESDRYFIEPAGMYWDGERVYTPTTARHISNFLAEYFPSVSYQEFKKAALNGYVIECRLEKSA